MTRCCNQVSLLYLVPAFFSVISSLLAGALDKSNILDKVKLTREKPVAVAFKVLGKRRGKLASLAVVTKLEYRSLGGGIRD